MANLSSLLQRNRRIRVVGVDDGPFVRGQRKNVAVFGAVCSGTRFEGLLTTQVRPDGFNATARLIEMISNSKFNDQLHAVLLDGITLGGFNVIDMDALCEALGYPVIAVMRKSPDFDAVYRVVEKLPNPRRRRRQMAAAGPVHEGDRVFFQAKGADPSVVAAILKRLTDVGNVPEPLRVAHLIGSGVVLGESGKRA